MQTNTRTNPPTDPMGSVRSVLIRQLEGYVKNKLEAVFVAEKAIAEAASKHAGEPVEPAMAERLTVLDKNVPKRYRCAAVKEARKRLRKADRLFEWELCRYHCLRDTPEDFDSIYGKYGTGPLSE